ncbi:phosphorylase b kinase regulatory subunit beta isoform X1 [Corvus cornix cornix]|nr:PREDICTED: phosphorylase b kinase regulatory subunit beta isoform X1 [Corvus brachyrhynchos]XP_039414072.1 phosphorylase b kinase regulatory subunit beta isoform X1 [Corvus cornix cornix]XP_039414073.1 phosphorylase b kinase regulatory subunit beta isoform X1 [Corvus cornix cornix]XP_041883485.1 phosphorylase b kinase regulatory subunit beta isoform X1 [Corvus kubaryi]XP_041883487.1 phosphorylase b kinase regulatory subunit beta isoform X1 [Corvus kubaryi]XP_041883488.1 phosphorylase b kina
MANLDDDRASSAHAFLKFEGHSLSGSIYEPLKCINLPKPEGETLWDKLNHYYRIVKSTLLLHQSPTTGLFPTKTYGDNQKAKVHDSLYCAACAWALALAYRRIDDDKGRTHELEHSAIKCMRGILYCYMRQADKVQKFKQDPKPSACLHSVFSAHTGDEVFSHKEYGHLQINAVSLFLLYLVEMISSGLQIIYNTDEVSFIQNLVFCVERAYRVPDFGVWERGSKYNNGSPELHSSSVGLAKAALEAINGFNLFGNQGCSWSVIFVDFDAHNRNRQTLCSLLPRESRSHNTDAALLPCLSYPAFALDDEVLFGQTLDKIIRKLKGKYGFKRFLRDGYRTALEDRTRRYYKPAEIKLFDGIECEFPLFFIFMIIDGIFKGNPTQVKEYQDLLDPLLQHTPEGCPVVPKYYYVPADFVELEKKSPGSQRRFPSNNGRDGKLFLWGQAVYIIAKLLADKLVSPKDLDPIGRYVPPEDQRNISMRFSNQGPLENDVVVHVALIAESQRLQVFLNTYGIQTQTPQQVEPIQIWAQKELVKAYFHLGVNEKLGLSGRPDRPIGCLGTSKIYRILGKTVVCYSIIFDLSDFYMSQDVMMLIDDIKNALQFIKQYWKMHGRPLFVVLIREDNIRGSRFSPILDMLAAFRKGIVGGVKVHVDRVQTLISGAVVEQLDFLRITETEEAPVFKSLEELDLPKHSKVKRQSSTPNASELEQQPDVNINDWKNKSTYEILQKLNDCNCMASQALLSSILLKREGPNFITKEGTVAEHIERIYRRAGSRKLWSVVRFAASLLGKLVDSLAPSITNVLVQGKQVTLGAFGQEEAVISNPLSPAVIKNIIYEKCQLQDEREAVVQQELVIHIGWIISNSPELFSGMLKIRIGWIIHAMQYELKIRAGDMPAKDLYQMSPSEVKQLLLDILQPQQPGRSWLNRRQLDGSLNRTPAGFYDRVWQILERTPNGLIVAGRFLPQQPTLSDMTMYEMNFSLLVEDMLQNIDQPQYRQIIVELLMVISVILERNPELEFQDKVDLDKVVQEAFHDFQKDHSSPKGAENQSDMTAFYNTHPLGKKGTCSYLSKAVITLLLEGEMKSTNDDPCTIS